MSNSILCLNVCRSCVLNIIMSLGVCFENCIPSKLARLLDTASKLALFSVRFERRKVDKKHEK